MGKIISRLLEMLDGQASDEDLIPIQDVSVPKTKIIKVSTLKKLIGRVMYPVGSIYINGAVDTNPGTLLGFGTWVRHASGRVMVGQDSTQTEFDTLGETGGQKTVQAHTHGVYHRNTGYTTSNPGGAIVSLDPMTYGYTHQSASAGSGVNNMNPYIVVYVWIRTA